MQNELVSYKQHLDEVLDKIYMSEDYGKEFDATITLNGKTIVLPMCADVMNGLYDIINANLEDYKEV